MSIMNLTISENTQIIIIFSAALFLATFAAYAIRCELKFRRSKRAAKYPAAVNEKLSMFYSLAD